MCLLNIYTVSRYLIVYLSISIYITFFSLIVVSSFGLPQKRKKLTNIDKFYFYLYMILGLDHDPRIASIRWKLLRL